MSAKIAVLTFACIIGVAISSDVVAQTPAPATPSPAAPAPATPAPPTRIRGSIAALTDHALTIKSREGPSVDVTLTDPLTVVTLKRVPLASISDNTFVGIASKSEPNGSRTALEVLVFPEAMRGVGEGDYPWDLQPGSMMTNATVTGVVKKKSGRDLALTYKTGSVTIHVPLKAPVVTFVPAERSDLKPGRKIFTIARKDAEGHLTTGRVTVATHGVNPPM